MKLFLLLLSAVIASAVEYRATVNLTNPEDGKVYGNLTLVQVDEGEVSITGSVSDLKPGKHGFHVHEKSNISHSCAGAGAHFNPFNKTHGAPTDAARHVGDLGNIETGQDGIAHVHITDKIIRLNGPNSILDLSIVVHADEDDLGKGTFADSLTTGHAGNRVACGKIINYVLQQSGSSESTTEMLPRRSGENKTVSDPSGSAPLYVSWTLVVLLSAALHLY